MTAIQMSAQIIQHPSAAAQPVVQRRGPGRRPKIVVCLFAFRRDKNIAQWRAEGRDLIASEIYRLQLLSPKLVAQHLEIEANLRERVRLLSLPDPPPQLLEQLKRERLQLNDENALPSR